MSYERTKSGWPPVRDWEPRDAREPGRNLPDIDPKHLMNGRPTKKAPDWKREEADWNLNPARRRATHPK